MATDSNKFVLLGILDRVPTTVAVLGFVCFVTTVGKGKDTDISKTQEGKIKHRKITNKS